MPDLRGRLSVQEQALKELQSAQNEILMETRFVHEEGFSFRIITQWSQTEQPNKMLQFWRTANEVKY